MAPPTDGGREFNVAIEPDEDDDDEENGENDEGNAEDESVDGAGE